MIIWPDKGRNPHLWTEVARLDSPETLGFNSCNSTWWMRNIMMNHWKTWVPHVWTNPNHDVCKSRNSAEMATQKLVDSCGKVSWLWFTKSWWISSCFGPCDAKEATVKSSAWLMCLGCAVLLSQILLHYAILPSSNLERLAGKSQA